MRNLPSIILIILAVIIICLVFFVLPSWVFFAFIGAVLIRIGWYLFDG